MVIPYVRQPHKTYKHLHTVEQLTLLESEKE